MPNQESSLELAIKFQDYISDVKQKANEVKNNLSFNFESPDQQVDGKSPLRRMNTFHDVAQLNNNNNSSANRPKEHNHVSHEHCIRVKDHHHKSSLTDKRIFRELIQLIKDKVKRNKGIELSMKEKSEEEDNLFEEFLHF